MSSKDYAKTLIDKIPDYKIDIVLAYLQGICDGIDTPNDETIAAIKEADAGEGASFSSLDALFADLGV